MKREKKEILLPKWKGDFTMSKQEKTINLNELEPEERLKYEIAEELGLLEQVLEYGWRSLSSKETGRIGGMVSKRKKL